MLLVETGMFHDFSIESLLIAGSPFAITVRSPAWRDVRDRYRHRNNTICSLEHSHVATSLFYPHELGLQFNPIAGFRNKFDSRDASWKRKVKTWGILYPVVFPAPVARARWNPSFIFPSDSHDSKSCARQARFVGSLYRILLRMNSAAVSIAPVLAGWYDAFTIPEGRWHGNSARRTTQ